MSLSDATVVRGSRWSVSRLNRLSLVLAAIGLYIAGTLVLGHLAGGVPPCGSSAGCGSVMTDSSAYVAGIPVAGFGLLAYLAFFALALARAFSGAPRRLIWLGFGLSAVGLGLSLGLIHHAVTALDAFCPWCFGSAATMALLFGTHLSLVRKAPTPIGGTRADLLLGVGLLVVVGGGVTLTAARLFTPTTVHLDFQALADTSVAELVGDAPRRGAADSPITIVEFSDLNCSSCRTMHERLTAFIAKRPTVAIVFRNLPLSHLPGHEHSYEAAVAGEIAHAKDLFWEYADRIFALEQSLTPGDIAGAMAKIGVVPEPESAPAKERVDADLALARRLGIDQTPTFLILVQGSPPIPATSADIGIKMIQPRIKQFLGPER